MVERAGRGESTSEPGIRLVLGPPNAGKLGYVVRWWIGLRDEAPVIVVPTAADVTFVVQELARAAGPLLGPPPVMTFRAVSTAVAQARATPPWDRRLLGPLEERLVVAEACRRSLSATPALARFNGGTHPLARLLGELAESGVAPAEIVVGLRSWGRDGGGPLAADLARLVEAFWGLMDEAKVGLEADLTRHAAASSSSWRRPVACYGFVSFTPVQRLLLGGLSRVAPVLLSLTHAPDRRWGEYFATEVHHWDGVAAGCVHLPRSAQAFSSPRVAALEAAFLAIDPPAVATVARGGEAPAEDEDGAPAATGMLEPEWSAADGRRGERVGRERQPLEGVRFILASGRRTEAELVAGEIAALLREGVSADDIGVLVREMGPWHRLLRRVFRGYGLPHRIDCELTLGETGLGAALLGALTGVAGAQAAPLLAYLRSPYCAATPDTVDRLGIGLRDMRASEGDGMLSEARARFPDAMRDVEGVLKAAPGGGWSVDLDALRLLSIEAFASAARGRAWDSADLEEDARAFAAMGDAIDELSRAAREGWVGHDTARTHYDPLPREPAPDRAPLDLVVRVLRERAVRSGRSDERGVVQAMTVRRARARRFHIVFLMGLVDGEFPRGERPPLLLTSEQRAAANRAAGRPLFSEPPSGEEAGLFALGLSRSWQLLYLCARDAEDGGEEVLPSPFWSEARRLVDDPGALVRRTLRQVVWPIEAAPTLPEYLRAAAAEGVVLSGDPGRRLREAAGSWECGPHRLEAPGSLTFLRARDVFSVTELEQYSQCPFAWFIARLVQPDSTDEPMDAVVLGQILHRALRDLYAYLIAEDLVPIRPEILDRTLALAKERVDQAVAALAPAGPPAEIRVLAWRVWERVESALELDAAAGSALVPAELEVDLPLGGVDLDGIRVRGRIDRVDSGPGGEPLLVIDYKSGGDARTARFGEPGALQVPLYLLALRRLYPERAIAGGTYAFLGRPSTRGVVLADLADLVGGWVSSRSALSGADMEAVLEGSRLAAVEAVQGIRAGLIPGTAPTDCPTYCDLQPLCRRTDRRKRW